MKIYLPSFAFENHSFVAVDAATFLQILNTGHVKSDYITDDMKYFLFEYKGDNWNAALKRFSFNEYKVSIELCEPPRGFNMNKVLYFHTDAVWYLIMPQKRKNLTFGMTFNQLSKCKATLSKIQQLLSSFDYKDEELLSEIDSIVDCLDVPFE